MVCWFSVVVEKRGKNEDDDLELEFRRICAGANFKTERWNFEVLSMSPKTKGPDRRRSQLSTENPQSFADRIAQDADLC